MLLKKFHVMFLSLLLITLLAACGSGGGTAEATRLRTTQGLMEHQEIKVRPLLKALPLPY